MENSSVPERVLVSYERIGFMEFVSLLVFSQLVNCLVLIDSSKVSESNMPMWKIIK